MQALIDLGSLGTGLSVAIRQFEMVEFLYVDQPEGALVDQWRGLRFWLARRF